MKPILPTLRENNRYLSFEIKTEDKIERKEIENKLQESFLEFLGSLELAKSSFKLIDIRKDKGIIKVNAKYLNKLKAMFTLTKMINNKKIGLKSLKTSGLLNKLKEEE